MIDLYYAPTPHGWKISIMLEECGLPYRVRMMDLSAGDQVSKAYRPIGPAGKIPGLVDDDPSGGGAPVRKRRDPLVSRANGRAFV